MILSDGEIKAALKLKQIIIDPLPAETQYTTSAVDLLLGPQLYKLKSLEDIQSEEPKGVQLSLVVDPSTVKITDLFQKYAVACLKSRTGLLS